MILSGPQTGIERGARKTGDRVSNNPRMAAAAPVKPAERDQFGDCLRRCGDDDPFDGTKPT